MTISAKTWNEYISRLSQLNQTAAQKMQDYINQYGTTDTKSLIDFAHALITKYGEGSAELACQMYDALAETAGVSVPAAEPAATADYREVAKMVNATKQSTPQLQRGVSRLVKRAAADTTLHNARRDGAEFAWVPHGDTCAFCLTLASRGWQRAGEKTLKGDHAEHIHANCDCEYAIRFDSNTNIAGYDPKKYLQQYRDAGGDINKMRRIDYAAHKDCINAQKRAAYAAKKSIDSLKIKQNDDKIYLEDFLIPVGVGAKAKSVYIKLPDGSISELTPGSRVTKVQTIAGNGRNRQIDIVDLLVEEYPGTSPEKWEKQKGFGYVDYDGESCLAELHWYYEPTVGRVKWKIKPDSGGNWFYDEDE